MWRWGINLFRLGSMAGMWVALGVICGTITSASQLYPPLGPYKSAHLLADRPLEDDPGLRQRCKERYRNATLDHYNWVLLSFPSAVACTRTQLRPNGSP